MCTEVNAKRYRVNDIIENQFVMNKKFKLNLSEGKWTVIRNSSDFYYGLVSKVYTLVRLENNVAVELIEIGEMKTANIYESLKKKEFSESTVVQ